jgi:hypothetical protein
MRGTPTIISCHPELAIPVRPTPAARQSARGTQPTGCALRERECALEAAGRRSRCWSRSITQKKNCNREKLRATKSRMLPRPRGDGREAVLGLRTRVGSEIRPLSQPPRVRSWEFGKEPWTRRCRGYQPDWACFLGLAPANFF